MFKALVLLFIASSSAQYLPNGCPSNFQVHLLLPHETDCDKFYSCSNGQRILLSCAPGTLFDESLQVCNHAFLVHCTPGSTTTSPTTVPTTSSSTTELPAPDILPNGCPADPHVHQLLPHQTDCSKFYQCSHGERVEMSCPAGLIFDVDALVCNWDFLGTCYPGATTSTTSTTISPSTTEQPDITESTTEQLNVTQTTSELPDITEITDQPDITQSTSDQPDTTQSTTEQLNITESTPEQPDTTQTTEQPETTQPTTPQTTTEAGFLPNGCPIDFQVHHMLPHETDCAKFYFCYLGEKVERYCPLGTHFDFANQICNWPSEANCQITTTIDPITTDPTTTDPTTTDLTTTDPTSTDPTTTDATTTDLTTTDSTTNDVTITDLTTTDLTTTDPTSTDPTTTDATATDLTTTDSTTNDVTITDPTTTDVTTTDPTTTQQFDTTTVSSLCPPRKRKNVADPDSCTRYFTCLNGLAIPRLCPRGFEFSPSLRKCVFISKGGCTWGLSTVPEDTTTPQSTTTEDKTTDEPITEDNATSEVTTEDNATSELTTEDKTTSEVTTETPICHPDETSNVADPYDCTRYFMCARGVAISQGCPNGFEFDPTFRVCVPISEGGCTYNQNAEQTSLQIQPEPTSIVVNLQESFFPLCNGVEGKVKDPENCDSFYLCSDGTGLQFFCDFGMEFSSEVQQCTMISGNGCSL